MWNCVIVVLLLIGVCATNEDFDQDVRVYDGEFQKWIAIDTQSQGAPDWVPSDGPIQTSSEPIEGEPIVKRRRVRKRKRRPQNFEREYQDEDLYPDRNPPRPRLRRPNRPHDLDEKPDQWRDEKRRPNRPHELDEPIDQWQDNTRRSNRPHELEDWQKEDTRRPSDVSEWHKDDDTSINRPRDVEEWQKEERKPNKPSDVSEWHKDYDTSSSRPRDVEEWHEDASRPTRLDLEDQSNQWRDEIMEEEPFRPIKSYKRRRLYPKYDEDSNEDVILSSGQINYDVENEEIKASPTPTQENIKYKEEKPQLTTENVIVTTTRAPIDLKAILKQAGGISLSELLQQKNLTLQDLINGEEHAILALTKMEKTTTEVYKEITTETEENIKPKRVNIYRRLPPLLNRKNVFKEHTNNDFTSTKEADDLDKKVTSPFVRKETKFFNDFKIYDTETTTERRIFVPSHPKFYTSINYKPNMKEIDSPKSTSQITTSMNDEENSVEVTTLRPTTKYTTTIKPIRKITLPPTLFKLRNKYPKTTVKPTVQVETENYPPSFVPEKAIKIDINELFGLSNLFNEQKTTEGPLKIAVDIQPVETTESISTTISSIEESSEKTEPEKLKPASAKEEINELLSDTMSRENLMNILSARNMTLKELLEQRERGSSQRHLADIFHNQTREPEPKEHLTVDIVKTARNPFLETNPISINTERKSPNIPDLESTFNRESRQNQILRKQAEDYNILNNPLFRTDEKKTNEVINKLIPVWRQAYTNMHNKPELNDDFNNNIILSDEASRVEEIENQIAEAVNGALNEIDTVSHKINDEDSYFNLPYGVRSAIIASATIVGISLFVFITIFIIFKLSQKKNKHLTYSNSLSSLKMRSPILETPYQKRMFGSLMDSTLGRRKKISTISTSEPQSLQDYLWENERKPFQ